MRATWILATCGALVVFRVVASANGADLESGTWAGEHIVMEVTSAGATVEFDCARGTLDAPLALDSGRRFDVAGSFTTERGGPTRGDAASRAVPARYTAALKDSALTLTVVLTENKETVGVFTPAISATTKRWSPTTPSIRRTLPACAGSSCGMSRMVR